MGGAAAASPDFNAYKAKFGKMLGFYRAFYYVCQCLDYIENEEWHMVAGFLAKLATSMLQCALDEGRSYGGEAQTAFLIHAYRVAEATARDPAH